MANSGAGKAVLVIDVQNCFLPGGSLGTTNSRNSEALPPSTLAKSIARFINKEGPEHVFVSKDYHPLGHSSFLSDANTAADKMNFPSAAKKGEFEKGIAKDRYLGKPVANPRHWGTAAERLDQKLWPEHCVQGTSGADVDAAFDATLSADNKAKVITILKGDTPDIDSYSVVADALGNFTPHDEDGKTFISILQESDINEIYITGIARDVCVFWSALDMLNYWILPAFKTGKIIKLIFMYDLTRPVVSGGAPYTDKTKDQIEDAAKELIAAMGQGPDVFDKVFEVREGGYGTSNAVAGAGGPQGGGRRSKKQTKKQTKNSRSHKHGHKTCRRKTCNKKH